MWAQDVDGCSAGKLQHVVGLLSEALRRVQSDASASTTIARHGGYALLADLRSFGQQLSATLAHQMGIGGPAGETLGHADGMAQRRRRLELATAEVNVSTSVMTELDPVSTAALLRAETLAAAAARRIQARFRGQRGRAELQERRQARAAHNQAVLTRAATFVQKLLRARVRRRKERLEAARANRRRALRELLLQRLVEKSRRIQQNLARRPAAATTVQAFVRGRAARRAIMQALQAGGAEALWAMNGHFRAAREWFLRFDRDHDGVLNRTELQALVVELRDQHGLPVADRVVKRETAELLNGSWVDRRVTRPHRTGLCWGDWLHIVAAAERCTTPSLTSQGNNGWSVRSPQLPPLGNKWYPVVCPPVSATAAPCVARTPLAEALWVWCGLSRCFL